MTWLCTVVVECHLFLVLELQSLLIFFDVISGSADWSFCWRSTCLTLTRWPSESDGLAFVIKRTDGVYDLHQSWRLTTIYCTLSTYWLGKAHRYNWRQECICHGKYEWAKCRTCMLCIWYISIQTMKLNSMVWKNSCFVHRCDAANRFNAILPHRPLVLTR